MAVYAADGRMSLGQGIASSREAERGDCSNYNLLGAFSLHSLRSCQPPCPKFVMHHISQLSDQILNKNVSCRLRTSVRSAGLRFQYLDVLFCNFVQGNRFQPADSGWAHHIRNKLPFHALRTEVHRHNRTSPYPSLVDAWHDLWPRSGERSLPLYAFVLLLSSWRDETERTGDPVLTRNTGNVVVDGMHYSHGWSSLVLFSMIAFVASYATGIGNVPWQQGELFSLEGAAYDSAPAMTC